MIPSHYWGAYLFAWSVVITPEVDLNFGKWIESLFFVSLSIELRSQLYYIWLYIVVKTMIQIVFAFIITSLGNIVLS